MKKLNLHKVIATIICLVGFPMWLGQYTRDHGDSTLMALLILVMISETIWGLWKRKINLNSNFEEDRIAPLWKRILACIADYLLINICSIAQFISCSVSLEKSKASATAPLSDI